MIKCVTPDQIIGLFTLSCWFQQWPVTNAEEEDRKRDNESDYLSNFLTPVVLSSCPETCEMVALISQIYAFFTYIIALKIIQPFLHSLWLPLKSMWFVFLSLGVQDQLTIFNYVNMYLHGSHHHSSSATIQIKRPLCNVIYKMKDVTLFPITDYAPKS